MVSLSLCEKKTHKPRVSGRQTANSPQYKSFESKIIFLCISFVDCCSQQLYVILRRNIQIQHFNMNSSKRVFSIGRFICSVCCVERSEQKQNKMLLRLQREPIRHMEAADRKQGQILLFFFKFTRSRKLEALVENCGAFERFWEHHFLPRLRQQLGTYKTKSH